MRSNARGIGLHFTPSHLQPSLASSQRMDLNGSSVLVFLPDLTAICLLQNGQRAGSGTQVRHRRQHSGSSPVRDDTGSGRCLEHTAHETLLRMAARCDTSNDHSDRFLNLTA